MSRRNVPGPNCPARDLAIVSKQQTPTGRCCGSAIWPRRNALREQARRLLPSRLSRGRPPSRLSKANSFPTHRRRTARRPWRSTAQLLKTPSTERLPPPPKWHPTPPRPSSTWSLRYSPLTRRRSHRVLRNRRRSRGFDHVGRPSPDGERIWGCANEKSTTTNSSRGRIDSRR